ncbi:unnamed protein product, partial [Owenia fusiformis]
MATFDGSTPQTMVCDLDICVHRILTSIDCMPRHEITEQLIIDIDESLLSESRQTIFDLAKSKLGNQCSREYGPVSARGCEQIEDIKLKKRTGDKKGKSLANDIYELYTYQMDLIKTFPRSVLTSVSHIPELRGKGAQPPSAPQMDTELKVMGLTEEVNALKREVSQLKKDHIREIDRLEKIVSRLKMDLGDHTCNSIAPSIGQIGPIASPKKSISSQVKSTVEP